MHPVYDLPFSQEEKLKEQIQGWMLDTDNNNNRSNLQLFS